MGGDPGRRPEDRLAATCHENVRCVEQRYPRGRSCLTLEARLIFNEIITRNLNMQRPINQVRGKAAGAPAIAKTIMLPHENPPIRLPTYPNLERTAVCAFETNFQTTSQTLGLDTRRVAAMRNAAAPVWIDTIIEDTDIERAKYGVVFDVVATTVTSPGPRYTGPRVPYGVMSANDTEHWFYWPLDRVSSGFANSVYQVYVVSNPLTLDYQVCEEDGKITHYIETVAAGALTYLAGTVGKNCWINIKSYSATANSRLHMVPTAGTKALFPAYDPPQIETSKAPYHSTRVSSLAVLVTNVSRVQQKQGTIIGARFSATTPAFWGCVPEDVNNVHPASRYFGACENGSYIVVPPTQDSEIFSDSVMHSETLVSLTDNTGYTGKSDYVWRPIVLFDTDDPFLALFISEDLTSGYETVMAYTVDIHLEFRTSSPLFQVGISAVPLEEYHRSQLIVAQAGYFYENATHWLDLAKKIGSLALKAAPYVIKAAPMVLPGGRIAKLASLAGMLLPARPKRHDMTQKQMVKQRPTPQRRRKRAKVQRKRR